MSSSLKKSIVFLKYGLKLNLAKGERFDVYSNAESIKYSASLFDRFVSCSVPNPSSDIISSVFPNFFFKNPLLYFCNIDLSTSSRKIKNEYLSEPKILSNDDSNCNSWFLSTLISLRVFDNTFLIHSGSNISSNFDL